MNTKKITEIIQREIDANRLGGAQIYLSQKGEVILNQAFGTTKDHNIFRIYSMSKIVTMVGIMMLRQDGLLSLSDSVSKYFPSFQNRKVYDENGQLMDAKQEMKISHLLNMTSGLGYPLEGVTKCDHNWMTFEKEQARLCRENKDYTMLDFCDAAGQIPGAFESGTKWKYSASADILGGIIQKVSGKPLDVFLKERLFEPLQMNDTDFYLPEDKADRIEKMYTRDANTGLVQELSTVVSGEKDIDFFTLPDTGIVRTCKPFFLSGGAGIYCTTADYAKFMQMLLNNGVYEGKKILTEETMQLIRTPQISGELKKSIYDDTVAGSVLQGYSYSNLVRIMTDPEQAKDYGCCGTVGEYGWDGLPGNYCMIDPEKEIILLFMIQISEGADVPFRAELRRLIYED